MNALPQPNIEYDTALLKNILSPAIADNPLAFTKYMFRWREEGTPLANCTGPRNWQTEVFLEIAEFIQRNKEAKRLGKPLEVYKLAIASARGIGKTALVAWITYWFLSTRIGCTVAVSANSDDQCKTTSFAELRRWHSLAKNSHFFEANVTDIHPSSYFVNLLKQSQLPDGGYGAFARLWKEESPDSYAGLHNSVALLLVFDEASGIPSIIFKTAEGFFTEDIVNRMWLVFSNPRRRSGQFFDIFDKDYPDWNKRHISGFDVEGIDHQVYRNWIRQYGEDSNIARHDVYGQFPLQDTDQFFSAESVKKAEEREPYYDEDEPLVMGIDVAGGGKDSTVAVFRRGLDAKTIPLQVIREKDQNRIISWVTSLISKYNPDVIVVDGNGIGNGVFYGLKSFQRFNVHEYMGQRKPDDEEHYANKRAENYYLLQQWMNHGSIEKNDALKKDLLSIQQDISSIKVQLVSKEKRRAKGIPSPDRSDALALTFHLSLPRVSKSRFRMSKASFSKTMSLGD